MSWARVTFLSQPFHWGRDRARRQEAPLAAAHRPRAPAAEAALALAAEVQLITEWEARLGLYPVVTLQYRSTTLYQVSYQIQSLCFESDNRIQP